jgi:hypothetical protein
MTSDAASCVGGRSGSVQRPSFSIRNRHWFEAAAIEMLEHGGRRRDGHFVLAGTPAEDDTDTEFLHDTISLYSAKCEVPSAKSSGKWEVGSGSGARFAGNPVVAAG